jgi:hypothetical protein
LTGSAFVSVDFGYDLPKWTESVALTLLVREGIAAIWQLHLSAAKDLLGEVGRRLNTGSPGK